MLVKGDRTSFAREVVEAALAHVIEDKTEAAYRRSDLSRQLSGSKPTSAHIAGMAKMAKLGLAA